MQPKKGNSTSSCPTLAGPITRVPRWKRRIARSFWNPTGRRQFVWEAHGGFDTYAVVLGLTGLLECADDTFDAILGIIEGLEDYPLIDDEALSNLESDAGR